MVAFLASEQLHIFWKSRTPETLSSFSFSLLPQWASQQRAKKSVPVREVWRIVHFEPEVVEVVMMSSSVEAEGHQPMWRPGELVAWVSLHGQVHVNDVEEHLSEWMAVQECRVQCCEEAQAQHLPDAWVLCHQRERGRVEVVLLVEVLVEPGHLVMEHMPQEVLRVEQEQASQNILNNGQHLRRQCRWEHRSEVPVYHRQRENETGMVVEDFT